MKKRLIILLLAGCMVLSGCGAKEDSEIQQHDNVGEKEEFRIEVESKIDQKECFLCGEAEDSLMGYYSKKESIGIFSNPVVTPIKKTMAQTIATMVSFFVYLYCLNFIFITHSSSVSIVSIVIIPFSRSFAFVEISA